MPVDRQIAGGVDPQIAALLQARAVHDLDSIRQGAYADPEVYPNDLVMVGDNEAKRLTKDLLTTFSLVSGPLVIALDRLAR